MAGEGEQVVPSRQREPQPTCDRCRHLFRRLGSLAPFGIARLLGERGWNVTVNFHSNADRAEAVMQAIQQAGKDAIAVGADATTPEAFSCWSRRP